MNVPKMLPAVETAYNLPTMFPVLSRSFNRNFTTTGVTIPSITLGRMKTIVVTRTIRDITENEINPFDTSSISGRILRLERQLARRISPRTYR